MRGEVLGPRVGEDPPPRSMSFMRLAMGSTSLTDVVGSPSDPSAATTLPTRLPLRLRQHLIWLSSLLATPADSSYPQWLDKAKAPTLKQQMDFAHMVHVDLFDLYSPAIPNHGMRIADFRTPDGAGVIDPGPDLYDTIEIEKRRQDWMRDYFIDIERKPIAFVKSWKGKATDMTNALAIADAMHAFLDLDKNWAAKTKDPEEAVGVLRQAMEDKGISVAINGVVGDNTHRGPDVQELRGFVLSDEYAPLVFINGNDAKGAQLLTMVHELCHLAFARAMPPPFWSAGLQAPSAMMRHTTFSDTVTPSVLKVEWVRR